MAFPSVGGLTTDNLSEAWAEARSQATSVKVRSTDLRAASAAGPIVAQNILAYATSLAMAADRLQAISGIPGIVAYAREQVNNPARDIAAEFTAMLNAVTGVRDWIVANFPKDANGWLLFMSFTADNSGRTQLRTLTTAQTAGLRTQLDALIATIE